MTKGINVLGLFDGMSGGQLTLKELGIKVNKYFASEIEPNAIKIAMKNFPKTIQLGDISNITGRTLKNLPKIDLIIGGSPCKNLSITVINNIKQNKGLEGKKSKLFYTYAKILKWIQNNNNPEVDFFLENVQSMSDKDKKIITEFMGVEPIMVDSADFSAQYRKRYYWTTIPYDYDYEPSNQVLRDIILTPEEIKEQPNGRMKIWYDREFKYVDTNGNVIAILDLNGHDIVKRIYSLDDKCATITTCNGGNLQKKIIQNGKPRKLLPIEYERLQNVPDNYTKGVSNTARYNMLGNGWTIGVIKNFFKNLEIR